jgi:hypothetical protein
MTIMGSDRTSEDLAYGRTFALLEWKVTGAIDRQTHFQGKCVNVVKQMTRYSKNDPDETKYVASFNWDVLFLAVSNNDREIMHGTLVKRDGTYKNRLRRTFLGWLLEAFNNNGKSTLRAPDRT